MDTPHPGITFNTKNGYGYYYSNFRHELIPCHPLLQHLINLFFKKIDYKKTINKYDDERVFIKDFGWCSANDLDYYINKFHYLKNRDFFKHEHFSKRFVTHLKAGEIKKILANVNQITFEVTDACNLECAYCGYGKFYMDYDKRQNKHIDLVTAKKLLNYLAKLWNSPLNQSTDREINIGFYGGEPLVNFDFIRTIVEYVNSLDLPRHSFRFAMTTNAVLLNRYMDFLKKYKFNLLISLDGNKHTNAYRVFKNGRPAFDTIMNNLFALQEKYPTYFKRYVNFNVVFHNLSSIASIHRFFKTNFNKMPTLSVLNTSGINPALKKEFWNMYASVQRNLEKIKNPKAISRDMFLLLPDADDQSWFIHLYADFCFNDYAEIVTGKKFMKRLLTGTCLPFERSLFLTVNGKIMACERIGQQYTLGRATPSSVHINFSSIARMYNRYFDMIDNICHKCYAAGHCSQCIFHMDLESNPVSCASFMTDDDAKRYFSHHISAFEKDPAIYQKIIDEVVIA